MAKRIKQGSEFLFCLIKTLNLAYGTSALALVALAIWLCVQMNTFDVIQIAFFAFGIFELILVALVWTAKTSIAKLRCFLYMMALIFLAELIGVVIVFALGQSIVQRIVDETGAQGEYDNIKSYLNIVNYYVIGSLAVEFLMMSFVYCYIGSLRNRNNQFDYKMMDEDGNAMSVEEKKERDTKKVEEKYSAKREELKNKYANYKNYTEK